MHFWQRLKKPEYLHNPAQLLRRLTRPSSAPARRLTLKLPWGLDITVSTGDAIGQAIWQMGVYDLTVSEVLWRLVDPGEACLDIGANLGYMTCLLSARTGRNGKVHAFEPHPEIHAELVSNAARWSRSPDTGRITLHAVGLSDHHGVAALAEPPQFEGNRGTSALETPETASANTGRRFEIPIRRLEDCLPPGCPIGIAKVDVEGHELGVLRGARRLLDQGEIRDIVYEDNDGYPGPVSILLESCGYAVRRIDRTLGGPRLIPASSRPSEDWLPSSFLASRAVGRADSRMQDRGWQTLQCRRKPRT
jgi:FkbM family methyltransferase